MNVPESPGPRDTDPSIIPPRANDPTPKREFGTMKGELALSDEFFDPLPPEEPASWEQERPAYTPSYRIDVEGNTAVVHIRRDAVGLAILRTLLAYLKIRSIQREGAVPDEEIDEVLSTLDHESADCLRWRLRNHPPDPSFPPAPLTISWIALSRYRRTTRP